MYLYLAIILLVLLSIVLIVGARIYLRSQHRKESLHKVYSIKIPKFSSSDESHDFSSSEFHERLSEVENMFSVLAATKSESGIKSFFYGRSDHYTLELVAKNGLIQVFAAVPDALYELFSQQVHSVYPNANIEHITDYNIFQPQGTILGGYFLFRRSFIFPIKTFTAFEQDPLESIATALGRVPPDSSAAIQYVLRSARPGWHAVSKKVVNAVYKGSSIKDAVRSNIKSKNGVAIVFAVLKSILGVFSATFFSSTPKKPETEAVGPRHISPRDQEAINGIENKASKAGFELNIRILVASPSSQKAESLLKNITDAFGQFNIYEYGNALKASISKSTDKIATDFIYRTFDPRYELLINAEEMVSLFHLPERVHAPNVDWLSAKHVGPPVHLPQEGIILGSAAFRGVTADVRIKDVDRQRHVYIIGQTGVGKSQLMKHMAIQDIKRGAGVGVVDPHGDLVESILEHVPEQRYRDIILFDPADTERPFGLNMLEYDTPEQKTFVINEMINIFEKLYDLRQTGGPMFEQYMRNAMLLIMEDRETPATLLDIPVVLADEKYRKAKLEKISNPVVKDFWTKEAAKAGGDAALANMVPYITSKLTQFISNDIMRPIIAQRKSAFNFRNVMDSKKILLINLSKGKIGDMNSSLLGMICVGKLLMASLSRVDTEEAQRKDFYLYIDEFQNYVSPSIATILSEARKYKLNLTLAHQYLGQLTQKGDSTVREAVFGNVGTIISFRIGPDDAETLEAQFAPAVSAYDLMNMNKYNAYIRLLIDNQNIPAFSFSPPAPEPGNKQQVQALKQFSRTTYGKDRAEVEALIQRTPQPEQSTKSSLQS